MARACCSSCGCAAACLSRVQCSKRPGSVRRSTSSGCRAVLQNPVKAAVMCARVCPPAWRRSRMRHRCWCHSTNGWCQPPGDCARQTDRQAWQSPSAVEVRWRGPACCFGQAQGAVPLDHAALLVHWCWYAMLGVVMCPRACSRCCPLYYIAARLFDAHTAWALYLLSCLFHCICGWLMHTPV